MNEKLKILREAIKIKKWEWIPIFGTFIYSIRVNMTKIKLEDKRISRIVTLGLGKVQWPFLVVSLGFLITFFVIRDKYGFGHWPWVFFAGMGIGITQLASPILHSLALKNTINNFEKKQALIKDEKKLTK